MKLSKRLTLYLLLLCVLSAFGLYVCQSSLLAEWRSTLVKFLPFCLLKGKNDLVSNLLLAVSTSSFFAALGFLINYYNVKKEHEQQLVAFYSRIRNECFDNLFYKMNYYDNRPEEVKKLIDCLNENMKVVIDYRPAFLLIKNKVYKLFNKGSNKDSNLYQYADEDLYGLICAFFSRAYSYFDFIHMHQCAISETKRMIKLFQNKKRKALNRYNHYMSIPDIFLAKIEKGSIEYYEDCLQLHKDISTKMWRRLVYRYNITQSNGFKSKKDLMAMCYAIDNKIELYVCSYYLCERRYYNEIVLEDSNLEFEPNDERIRL